MGVLSWLRRAGLSPSWPDPSPAGGGAASRRPASPSGSSGPAAARAGAGCAAAGALSLATAARRLLPRGLAAVLLPALLALPLLLGLAAPAAAQTTPAAAAIDLAVEDAHEGEDIKVTLTLSAARGNSPAGTRTFTINTAVPSSADVTTCINRNTGTRNGESCPSGSTPAAASDFTAQTNATVVFGPTETQKTFTIPTATDAVSEGAEVVQIKIEVLTGTLNFVAPFTGRMGFTNTSTDVLNFPTYLLINSFGVIRDGARPGPAKPTGVTATPGNGQVTLSWTDPGNSSITKWQYRFSATSLNWQDISGSGATTTSHTVTGLTNGRKSEFQIRAVTAAGDGAASDRVSATPEAPKPAKPTGFEAAPGNAQVVLSWNNPSDSTITKYQYRQKTTGAYGSWTDLSSTARTTSVTLISLTNGTAYTYQIRAVNAAGDGPASDEVTVTPGAPAKPTGFTATPGNNRVVLSWDDPGDSSITKYQARGTTTGSFTGNWLDIITSSAATATSFTVTPLQNGTEVTYQIRAVNAHGEGPASDSASATPTADSTAPTVSSIVRQSPGTELTNSRTLTWRVTFDEAVRNVDATDFKAALGSASGTAFPLTTLSVSEHGSGGTTWDVTATISSGLNAQSSMYLVFVSTHNIQDTAGNALAASPAAPSTNENRFEVDTNAPEVDSITRQTPSTSPTDADSLTWRVTFSDWSSVQNVDAADFTVTGTTATVTGVSQVQDGDGQGTNAWDITVSGGDLASFEGTVTLGFASNNDIRDEAGNPMGASPQFTQGGANDNTFVIKNIDPLAPRVASIVRHSPSTATAASADELAWRVTFRDPLLYVRWTDFRVTHAGAALGARIRVFELRSVPGGTDEVLVVADGGGLRGVSGTVTLELAPVHHAQDGAGRKLPNLDPVGGGADERTFTLDSTKTAVSFTHTRYRVTEGDEAVVTLKLSKRLPTATTVRFSATPLTATGNGVDYHGQIFTATIRPWRSTAAVRIRTTKDGNKEGDESFRLDISSGHLPAGLVVAAPDGTDARLTQTLVTISDPPPPLSETPRLVFDTTHLRWNEADGCGGDHGPSYKVKLGTRPPNDVTVVVHDPNDLEYPSVRSRTLHRVSVDDNEVGWKGRYLTFKRDKWNVWQTVKVKVACTHHYAVSVPVVNSVSGLFTRYPGAMGKSWTVHVDVLDANPPIQVKDLPARGETVTVADGGDRDFRIRVSEEVLPAGGSRSVTVRLASRSGPVRVARRDGRARSDGAYYSDSMRFTASTREQWVRLSDSGCPGRDCDDEEGRLQVVIHDLDWGDLTGSHDWEMSWPVTVTPGGVGATPAGVPTEAVTNLQVTAADATSANVTWDAVEHATSYDVSWDLAGEDGTSAGGGSQSVTGTSATIRHDAASAMTLTVTVTPEHLDGIGRKQRLGNLAAEAELAVGPGTTQDSVPQNADVQAADAAARAAAIGACVSDSLMATTERYYDSNRNRGPDYGINWFRVLVAFGRKTPGEWTATSTAVTPATGAFARGEEKVWHGWKPFAEALECIETKMAESQSRPEQQQPAPVPEVTVSGGAGVTEGAAASFTVTANPAPASPLDVTLTITQSGDFAASGQTGARTVTVPTTGSVNVDIPTVDDGRDEPDGSITVTVDAGTGYTVGGTSAHTVSVADNDVPALPELSLAAGSAVDEGTAAGFTVTATPAPQADIAIAYTVAQSGTVLAAPGAGQRTAVLAAGKTSVALAVATVNDAVDEPDGSVTVTLDAGTGYTVAAGAGSGAVTVRDDDVPAVSIAAGNGVTEGAAASFTVTADPVPHAALEVALTITQDGDFAASGETGARTVTVPTSGSVTVEVDTEDDAQDEPDGSVTATVGTGTGYAVAAAPANAATVEVADNDAAAGVPTLSVADVSGKESDRFLWFTVRLSRASEGHFTVYMKTRDSTPVSAEAMRDYLPYRNRTVYFRPGDTEQRVPVYIFDDSHDEDPETFELVLTSVWQARGGAGAVAIGDGVAVGTISNDDPMPAAWLARFGRAVAEQALRDIADRIAAPRTAGMEGVLAGQALGGGGADAAPGGGSSLIGSPASADRFDREFRAGFGETGSPGPGQGMSLRELMLSSSFTMTGAMDGAGGSMAFWGRASESSFDGLEGSVSFGSETVTALLGTDYARGPWLLGMALAESEGASSYTSGAGSGLQACPEGMDEALCDGAAFADRAGDGSVEGRLTAAIPYLAFQASERLRLWGAMGQGSGTVTVKPALGGRYEAATGWTMTAAGLRGDLLAGSGTGPALAVTSDALWVRTSSEKTRDLAASESDVSRLRLGLEGRWTAALGGDASLTPKLELGARHDGGDAETGFGVEFGGGLAWVDPKLGLVFDLSARTLLAHDAEGREDRGVAAQLSFDPDRASARGLSLSLAQDWGGRAQGGLDALFADGPPDPGSGSGAGAGAGPAESRWQAEAAWGFPALGGRFTGSPHIGLGLATGSRDYSLGWRLEPEAGAPGLSFGLKATRKESDGAAPEHTVGVELGARW